MSAAGLYIHVPFCAAKCPYCDFYSMPGTEETMDVYTSAVLTALEALAAHDVLTAADTLYFGGGTPSLLGGRRLAQIVGRARELFGLADAEITVECNPGGEHVPGGLAALFSALHTAGVNRISMGLQSAQPDELLTLGRRHTREDAAHAMELAHAAGFDNVSLDLMLGLPGQTPQRAEQSARFCAALGALHISAYLLKVEPGTPFAHAGVAARCPDDDAQADIYLHTVEVLASLGFVQYEISNFAKPGRESRHNLKYWSCTDYAGVGPAAHSLTGGTRWYYPRDLHAFLQDPLCVRLEADDTPARLPLPQTAPTLPQQTVPPLPHGAARVPFAEYAMLRLRLTQGLCRAQALAAYPEQARELAAIFRRAEPLARGGLVVLTPEAVMLTPRGFLLSNAVTLRLLQREFG